MLDFMIKGGVVMIPILACSVIALAIVIERFINLTEGKVIPKDFFARI